MVFAEPRLTASCKGAFYVHTSWEHFRNAEDFKALTFKCSWFIPMFKAWLETTFIRGLSRASVCAMGHSKSVFQFVMDLYVFTILVVQASRVHWFSSVQKSALIVYISNISCQKYYVNWWAISAGLSILFFCFFFCYVCCETNASRVCVRSWSTCVSVTDGRSFDVAIYRPNALDPVFKILWLMSFCVCGSCCFYCCAKVVDCWMLSTSIFFIHEPCFGRGLFHFITGQNLLCKCI